MADAPLLSDQALAQPTLRRKTYEFLEAKTRAGLVAEAVICAVILLNVLTFILNSVPTIHDRADALFDWIEAISVVLFTIEYLLRFWSISEEPRYKTSRILWVFSFFSLVDLACIVPFYVDLALTSQDLPASQFVRLLRLLRMMRAEGRYFEAFTTFDDIFRENSRLFALTGFVSFTVWVVCSSLYWLAERDNPDMILEYNNSDGELQSYHRFGSIPSASYYTLVNMFGEYPLIVEHSSWGKVIGTFIAVFACGLFGIVTGILGSGFEEKIQARREEREKERRREQLRQAALSARTAAGFIGGRQLEGGGDKQPGAAPETAPESDTGAGKPGSLRRRVDDFVSARTHSGRVFETCIMILILLNVIAFMASTVQSVQDSSADDEFTGWLWWFEAVSVAVFTLEYAARVFCGGWRFALSFYGLVDLASIVPFFVDLAVEGNQAATTWLRALRLLRLLKGEQYVEAFTLFDDVLSMNADVLIVTGFVALVTLVFFSTFMYYAERNNPIADTRQYYTTIPDAMWITLLNLTGEMPLADYTAAGKVLTAIMGIFAVGFFGIPIGLLGAGFGELIERRSEEDDEPNDEESGAAAAEPLEDLVTVERAQCRGGDASFVQRCAAVLRGEGRLGRIVETTVVTAIWISVLHVRFAVLGTVDSLFEGNRGGTVRTVFDAIEIVCVVLFTAEWLARLWVAPQTAELERAEKANGDSSQSSSASGVCCSWRIAGEGACAERLNFAISFYSIVDLLAIVPYYVTLGLSGVDPEIDNILRMVRIVRLVKLDRFAPSFSLLDDVVRSKQVALAVTGYAAAILWVVFATLLYLAEHNDKGDVGPGEHSMAWRFRNVPNSLQYTLVLLTGDYPLIDWTVWGKLVNVAMICFAVGLVAVPTALICDGFCELQQERRKERKKIEASTARGVGGERSDSSLLQFDGSTVESDGATACQPPSASAVAVHCFLEGENSAGFVYRYVLLVLILLNILAVMLESVDSVYDALPEALWEAFEIFSVIVFSIDYACRLYAAAANSKFEYSRLGYALSFYGLADVISVLPFYVELVLSLAEVPFDSAVFRVFRVFRVLQLEHFLEAFSLLDDVYRECEGVLKATGLLALMVWLSGGTLLYITEGNGQNPEYPEEFGSIPECMYLVAVFLGGEWGVIDFTVGGKVVCCVFCLLGIGLYAIPIGFLFDAFGEVLGEKAEGGEDGEDDEE